MLVVADLNGFFEWVGLVNYTLHCTHLTDTGDPSAAVSLAMPPFPERCWSAEVAILWAELCFARGVALAETVLDVKTYLKTCWSYRSNRKLHRTCAVTARKRSHDVLADSSPEQSPRMTRTEEWPEEYPHDDIIFRSDKSGTTCRTTKGRKKPTKLTSKSSKQIETTKSSRKTTKQSKSISKQQEKALPQQQPHPPVCADVVWSIVETFLQCYLFCYPVCPSVLVREACLWLSTCIGHHDDKLAAYFLQCSHGNSLHHQMVDLYGRQIQ